MATARVIVTPNLTPATPAAAGASTEQGAHAPVALTLADGTRTSSTTATS